MMCSFCMSPSRTSTFYFVLVWQHHLVVTQRKHFEASHPSVIKLCDLSSFLKVGQEWGGGQSNDRPGKKTIVRPKCHILLILKHFFNQNQYLDNIYITSEFTCLSQIWSNISKLMQHLRGACNIFTLTIISWVRKINSLRYIDVIDFRSSQKIFQSLPIDTAFQGLWIWILP